MGHIDEVQDYHGRGRHHDESQDGVAKLLNGPNLLQLAAWLIAALLAYGAINARISVLENRVDSMKSDVSEIKNDMKTLLRRPQ